MRSILLASLAVLSVPASAHANIILQQGSIGLVPAIIQSDDLRGTVVLSSVSPDRIVIHAKTAASTTTRSGGSGGRTIIDSNPVEIEESGIAEEEHVAPVEIEEIIQETVETLQKIIYIAPKETLHASATQEEINVEVAETNRNQEKPVIAETKITEEKQEVEGTTSPKEELHGAAESTTPNSYLLLAFILGILTYITYKLTHNTQKHD